MRTTRHPDSVGHRQVALLGLAALLVVLAVAGTAIAQTNAARRDLDRAERTLRPVIRHLHTTSDEVAKFTSAYIGLLTYTNEEGSMAAGSAASVGGAFNAATSAWRAYQAASLDLLGEADIAAVAGAVMDTPVDVGRASLASALPIPVGDAAALQERMSRIRDTISALAPTAAIDELAELYDDAMVDATTRARQRMQAVVTRTMAVALLLGVPLLASFAVVRRSTRRRDGSAAEIAAARLTDAERNAFEAQLQRAFDVVQTEDATFPVVERALVIASAGLPAEFLVADSSRAHLRQVATTDPPTGGPGCPVGSPIDCPAAQRGQTQLFTSSDEIDACPHLRGHSEGPSTAVCVPVSIAGKTAGVVHAAAAAGTEVPTETVVRLELVARKAGDRLGMLRAFARSETQARTDPLTGLLNRRSLESESREIVDSGTGYAVAFGDLDHFKQLNDVHGHDAGDRALRLFARVLRDSVRPTDIPARYGGEEFVVVLPDCSARDAAVVLDRVRTRLADALVLGSVPPFTVSFGVASSDDGAGLHDVIERADAALLSAKTAGRDRTVESSNPLQTA